MLTETLAVEAAKAAIGSLTKEAVGPALAAGGRVWAWLRTLLSSAEGQAMFKAVEDAPTKSSAHYKLSGAILELLETQPGLVADLERLLAESGSQGASAQISNILGNRNVTTQIAGDKNIVNVRRN